MMTKQCTSGFNFFFFWCVGVIFERNHFSAVFWQKCRRILASKIFQINVSTVVFPTFSAQFQLFPELFPPFPPRICCTSPHPKSHEIWDGWTWQRSTLGYCGASPALAALEPLFGFLGILQLGALGPRDPRGVLVS